MKHEPISFLCVDVEKVFNTLANNCVLSQYNLTDGTKASIPLDDFFTPQGAIKSFTNNTWSKLYGGVHVGDQLNGFCECSSSNTTSIGWLYAGDPTHHTLNMTIGSRNSSTIIEKLLQIPNATSVSNLSITCTGHSFYEGRATCAWTPASSRPSPTSSSSNTQS